MKPVFKLTNLNSVYYNANKVYSYNMFYNLILGGRGIGKTTTFLIKLLQRAIKTGKQFIYLRRYKSEVVEFLDKGGCDYIMDGLIYKKSGKSTYKIIYENKVLGYIMILSMARTYKSSQYPNVETIFYDEAICNNTNTYKYLTNEVTTFFEFVGTIFRLRTDTRIIMTGNNEQFFNPYFAFFGVPIFDKVYIDKERGIYCELAKHSENLQKLEQETPLYKLINSTNYGQYYYENKVLDNRTINISTKPSNSHLYFRLLINNNTINVYTYMDKGELKLYCERKDKIIDDSIAYPIIEDNVINYYYLELFKKKFKTFFYRQFFNGYISYTDDSCGSMIQYLIENM